MSSKENTEILFLEPAFKRVIWGGSRLKSCFGYPIPGEDTGESWGIAAHPHGDCTVRTGKFKGKKLSELWKQEKGLFGNLPGDSFPLLIKIIDAQTDLSVQVHPDDLYAREYENGASGKTECWYIIDCPENAYLFLGHHARTKEELKRLVTEGKWRKLLKKVTIHKGDFIRLDPGTLHAITAGCLLLETQQNSDITYRIYDYDRLKDGKPRELHIEKGLDVITVPDGAVEKSIRNVLSLPQNRLNKIMECAYFSVYRMETDGKTPVAFEQDKPFLNITVLEGAGTINGSPIKKGDNLILPYGYGRAEVKGKVEIIASGVEKN